MAAALVAIAATARALFGGRYLPYIDWSNHLGLMSVMAHGGTTGALDYMTRSWAPTPYLSFYAATAIGAQLVAVDVAAKAVLAASAGLWSFGAASLARATGRDPRLGVVAPLGFFGLSMGWGFGTFVFATPFLFFVLAAAEDVFTASDPKRWRAIGWLSFWLALLFLGHALVFLTGAFLVGTRGIVTAVWRASRALRAPTSMPPARAEGPVAPSGSPDSGALAARVSNRGRSGPPVLPLTRRLQFALRPITDPLIAAFPVMLMALPVVVEHLSNPWNEAGTVAVGGSQIAYFADFADHQKNFWGHLLERGSETHRTIMKLVAGYWGALLVMGWVDAWRVRRAGGTQPKLRFSMELYAGLVLVLFLAGPNSLEWPSSIWMVYPRYGVIAGPLLFLILPVRLRGVLGATVASAALALIVWNTELNRGHISRFSGWAQRYDPVRAKIPPRSRVLALSYAGRGDLSRYHPALGSLYFYHLVDGASYVAFLFDAAALPIRQRPETKPRSPFWKKPFAFNPKTHGKDYDFLVLRGKRLIDKASKSAEHEHVETIDGWAIFRTKSPTPRPSERAASRPRPRSTDGPQTQ